MTLDPIERAEAIGRIVSLVWQATPAQYAAGPDAETMETLAQVVRLVLGLRFTAVEAWKATGLFK